MTTENKEFTFSCPHCGQHLAAEVDWVGLEFECPTCGMVVSVPQYDSVMEGIESPDKNKSQVVQLQSDDQSSMNVYSVKIKAIVRRTMEIIGGVVKSFFVFARWLLVAVVGFWRRGLVGKVSISIIGVIVFLIVGICMFGGKEKNCGTGQASANGTDTHSARQAWDIDSLRRVYSKPMSPDQEMYNNLLYLYFSMQNNYSKYNDMKKAIYEFDHAKLSSDMKELVSRFVLLLDTIGVIERRIDDCQSDRAQESSDSSVPSLIKGGLESMGTLSRFDDRGDVSGGAYLLAGLIGGVIEASENDARIKKKYERAVREYREKENSLYIGFRQDINKLRNSEVFNAFDKQRLLPEDAISSLKEKISQDSTEALQLVQCRVLELVSLRFYYTVYTNLGFVMKKSDETKTHSMRQPGEVTKQIIACIVNYPQNLINTRETEKFMLSGYYFLSVAVLFENGVKKFPDFADKIPDSANKYLNTMTPYEMAAIASDSIAILSEGIKYDRNNCDMYGFRAELQFASGDYQGALTDISNAISISPQKSYFYTKACILAKGFKDADGAKTALREAFKKGFHDIKKLKEDKDLSILQSDPEFIEMTKEK